MQEESIYNLIPKEYNAPEKQKRYTSKFRNTIKDENGPYKEPNKTMGPAKVNVRAPNEFLKSHEKEPKLTGDNKFQYSDTENRRPPVPRRDDKPIHGIRTTKDFIKQNAVETIMSVPGKPDKKFVDTRKGDTQNLIPSGLEPNYIHKKEFGKTPAYLESRKREMAAAQADYDNYVQDRFKQGAMNSLSMQEREEILAGLKANWEQIHHEYQGLSVVTDTAPKKNRKERMEAEMKQLERDIETIEKHRMIYISN